MSNNFLSEQDWANFESIVNDFGSDVSNGTIIWQKYLGSIPQRGDDEDTAFFAEDVTLNCISEYNAFRTWPLTKYTDIGETDQESEVCLLNNSYLNSLNLLDGEGNFAFDAGKDRFIHKGILYYCSGFTPLSQSRTSDLYTLLVLKRIDVSDI